MTERRNDRVLIALSRGDVVLPDPFDRRLVLHLPTPIGAVLRLDPPFRDDALELVRTDRVEKSLAVVERLRCLPVNAVEVEGFELRSPLREGACVMSSPSTLSTLNTSR